MNPEARRIEWHPKGWGGELWLANNEHYCGKLMFLEPGKKCSIHYHRAKLEDFALLAGKMRLDLYPGWAEEPGQDRFGDPHPREDPAWYTEERRNKIILGPGDALQIPRLTPHQFTGIERCLFIETSTQHFDSDSYRIVQGDVLKDGEKALTPEFLISIAKMLPW